MALYYAGPGLYALRPRADISNDLSLFNILHLGNHAIGVAKQIRGGRAKKQDGTAGMARKCLAGDKMVAATHIICLHLLIGLSIYELIDPFIIRR
ncbi:MAG: hypothetical protein ACP5IL_01090 [Syntrophobacteraceae bacterium]